MKDKDGNSGLLEFGSNNSGTVAERYSYIQALSNFLTQYFEYANTLVLQPKGGKLGIGIATPAEDIHAHVSGSDSVDFLLTNDTTGTTSTDGFKIALGADEKANLWNYEDTNMVFGTNNNTVFSLINTGISKFWGPETHIDRAGLGNGFLKLTASSGYDVGMYLCEGNTDELNWGWYVDGNDSDKFKMIDSASRPIFTFANNGSIVFNATNGVTVLAEGTNYPIIHNKQYYDNGVHAPIYRTVKGRGTESSPTQVLDHDILSIQQIAGYDNTPELENAGQLVWYAIGDWTATNEGCVLYIQPTGYGNYNRTTIAGFYGEGVAIGNNGVGDTDNYELYVTGNAYCTGSWASSSNRASKRDILPIQEVEKANLLQDLDSLQLNKFKFKPLPEKTVDDFEPILEPVEVTDTLVELVYDKINDTTITVLTPIKRIEQQVISTPAEQLEEYIQHREESINSRHLNLERFGIITDDLPDNSPIFIERKDGRRDLDLSGSVQYLLATVKLLREEQLKDRTRISKLETEIKTLKEGS